ncbi:MAG: hypothetical protein WBK51_13930 [Polaromonas sp.]
MNSPTTLPTDVTPVDPVVAKQSVPGFGVPSQNPESGAQVGLSREEAERESKSALIGGGMVAGLVTGSAVGAVVAEPVGILVGGTVGAIAGVVGSNAAGELVNTNISATASSKPDQDHDNSKP